MKKEVSLTFPLSKGGAIPAVGLGTWQLDGEEGHDAILYALQNGYRMIDGAYSYFNQETVGKAIRDSGVNREDIFLVEKLANTWHSAAQECLDRSLDALQVDYLDLWLMHWPSPLNHNGNDPKTPKLQDGSIDFEKDWDYVKTWKTMVAIQEKHPEKVKRIGVANFGVAELQNIMQETGHVPVVNQVELHPANNQQKLIEFCAQHGIQIVAYSPLGSIGAPLLANPQLQSLAKEKNASVAQLMLSWGVANGWPVIPRSKSPERILQNIDLVDLEPLDIERITAIGLENRQRFINASWHTFSDSDY